jgi:hypothetical protein
VIRSRWLTLRRLTLGLALVAAVLGAGFVAVRWRERTMPPQTLFVDFNDQAAPAFVEFEAILRAMPPVDELEEGSASPASRQDLSQRLLKLRTRAAANRDRLGRIITPDPSIQSICQALIDAQTAQLAALTAGLAYLETPTPEGLTGPSGVRAGQTAMIRDFIDFQNRHRAYLETHGLIARGDASRL